MVEKTFEGLEILWDIGDNTISLYKNVFDRLFILNFGLFASVSYHGLCFVALGSI